MAEPAEEAYRENAREEGDVEPRDRAAPRDVAKIAEDRNKVQDCEGDVASRQGPDPEEIVLAARMKRFFFSSRRRHTRFDCDWSSDVCSSDLSGPARGDTGTRHRA